MTKRATKRLRKGPKPYPPGKKRSENIGVKATPAERRAWTAAAEKDGRTLSAWIARRCNGQDATPPVFEPGPE